MKNDIHSCENLVEVIEATFDELDSTVCVGLRKAEHKEYAEVNRKIDELLESYPVITRIKDSEGAISLTADEHEALNKHHVLVMEKEDIERLHIYLRGHSDCYAYLKQIGAML